MATKTSPIGNDVHLYPFYLKCASQSFREGSISDAEGFFEAACGNPQTLEHSVYRQMWKIKVLPNGSRVEGVPEYGRYCFHDHKDLFSSALEKAEAIDKSLKKIDQNELNLRENQIHKCLWKVHKEPKNDREYGRKAFCGEKYSSLQDKLLAVQMYANESRVLTWLTDRGEVRLVRREDGGLERIAIDNVDNQFGNASIPLGGKSSEEVISLLFQCDATVSGGAVAFSKQIISEKLPAIFRIGDRDVKLIVKDDRFVWHVFDKSLKTSSWTVAGDDVIQAIKFQNTESKDKRISFFKNNFNIEMKFDERTNRILSVFVKRKPVIYSLVVAKIPETSALDSSKVIDQHNWAVTLISTGISGECKLPFANDLIIRDPQYFGHAELIYEGVEKGSRFTKLVHIVADRSLTTSQVIHTPISRKVSYQKKGPTWVRQRALVEKMINRIKADETKTILFNLTGNDLLSKNTWQLAVDSFWRGVQARANA